MTITISEILHATTGQALTYAKDYYANYYSPGDPPLTWHRFDHSEHIEVLATWGHYHLFFVQSRIKQTVLYGLPSEWTDEIAMRGWVFYRDPATALWDTECDSTVTNLHHWQEIHHLLKKEQADMSDILDLLTEIRDSTANSEALLNALASEDADLFRVEAAGGDKIFSFETIVEGLIEDQNLAAGEPKTDGGTVPPTKFWLITHLDMKVESATINRVRVFGTHLATDMLFFEIVDPVSSKVYHWDGQIFMQNPDRIQIQTFITTLGDVLEAHYVGVQMDAP